MRLAVGIFAAVTLALTACGGDPDSDNADSAKLPKDARDFIACAEKAGIEVHIPDAVRRLAEQGTTTTRTAHGASGSFPLVYFFTVAKGQKLTPAQRKELDACRVRSETSHISRERVDALGTASPILRIRANGGRLSASETRFVACLRRSGLIVEVKRSKSAPPANKRHLSYWRTIKAKNIRPDPFTKLWTKVASGCEKRAR